MPKLEELGNIEVPEETSSMNTKEFTADEDENLSRAEKIDRLFEGDYKEEIVQASDDVVPQAVKELQNFNYLNGSAVCFITGRSELPKLAVSSRGVVDTEKTAKLKDTENPKNVYVGADQESQAIINKLYDALLAGNEEEYQALLDAHNARSMYSFAQKESRVYLVEQKPTKPRLSVLEVPDQGMCSASEIFQDDFTFQTPDATKEEIEESKRVILLNHGDLANFTLAAFGGKIKESPRFVGEGQRPGLYKVELKRKLMKNKETGVIEGFKHVYKIHSSKRKTLLAEENFLPLKTPRTKKIADLTPQEVTALSTEYLESRYEDGAPQWDEESANLVSASKTSTGEYKIDCKLLMKENMPTVQPWLSKYAGLNVEKIQDPKIAIKDGGYDYMKLGKDYDLEDYPVGKYLLENNIYLESILEKVSSGKKKSSSKIEGDRAVIAALAGKNKIDDEFFANLHNLDKAIQNSYV